MPPSVLVQCTHLAPTRPQGKTQARVQFGSTKEQACSDGVLTEHLLCQALDQVLWEYKWHIRQVHCPQRTSSLVKKTRLTQKK